MAYVPGYDYDIFISFSHQDNRPRPDAAEGERGWVEQFRDYLEWWLARRNITDPKVWLDKQRLAGNTDFDQRIEHDLDSTALLFVLHSHNYRQSDYCAKELDWFVKHANKQPAGLTVSGNRRIFNILINNIPHADWDEPLSGTPGFVCHDAKAESSDYGYPIEPDNRAQFDHVMGRIVAAAAATLSAFPKPAAQDPGSPDGTRPTLFIADVADNQTRMRKRIIKAIGSRVEVLPPVPPPSTWAGHDQAVRQALQQADLSLHLLDPSPGREMEDAELSYPCRQVELATASDTPSLLWLSDTVQIDHVEDPAQQHWLASLESAARDGDSYRFQHSSQQGLIAELLDRIDQLARPDTGPRSFVIDPRGPDQSFGFELAADLTRGHARMKVRFTSDADQPASNWSGFEDLVRQAQDLIVLFGQAEPGWVQGRVERAFKVAVAQLGDDIGLQNIWVLLLPDSPGAEALKLNKLISFEVLDNRDSPRISDGIVARLLPKTAANDAGAGR